MAVNGKIRALVGLALVVCGALSRDVAFNGTARYGGVSVRFASLAAGLGRAVQDRVRFGPKGRSGLPW